MKNLKEFKQRLAKASITAEPLKIKITNESEYFPSPAREVKVSEIGVSYVCLEDNNGNKLVSSLAENQYTWEFTEHTVKKVDQWNGSVEYIFDENNKK